MADSPGTLESLAEELGLALASLEGVLTPSNATVLFAELGLDAPPNLTGDAGFTQKLEDAAQQAAALFPDIQAISTARDGDDSEAVAQAIGRLINAIAQFVRALDA